MTEEFVKKQVYVCNKCGRWFDTKEQVSTHYKDVHKVGEKYFGKYFVSKDKDKNLIGVVDNISRDASELHIHIFEMSFSEARNLALFDISIPPFGTYTISSSNQTTSYIPVKLFEERFTIVSFDIAKDLINQMLIKIGYEMLKGDYKFRAFRDLLKDRDCRLKDGGVTDGN